MEAESGEEYGVYYVIPPANLGPPPCTPMGAGKRAVLSAAAYVVKRGDVFKRTQTFGHDLVANFTKLTGDNNRIHSDTTAARAAGFDDILVPGILCASLFPTIIARQFPGAVYLTQTLQFKRPVQVNSTIHARVLVTQVSGKHVRFQTTCLDAAGKIVVDGLALARL